MALPYRSLRDASLFGKRVVVRAGFDVPIEDGKVTDTTRIRSLVPTMQYVLDQGASLVILAHQDRPKGKIVPEMSQKPLVSVLSKFLNREVSFAPEVVSTDTHRRAEGLHSGEVLLIENLRFDAREEKNDDVFADTLASLGDVYVNDAFANSHRNHASMCALARRLPAYMGFQLEQELTHLSEVLTHPRRPLTLIVGGAKMETKIPVLRRFEDIGNTILVGGAIANTFLAAKGEYVGASLYEEEQIEQARALLSVSGTQGKATVMLPLDALVAASPEDRAKQITFPLSKEMKDMRILDIGQATTEMFLSYIKESETVVWNGPVGFSEVQQFAHASEHIAHAIAEATKRGALTVAGGGDTIEFFSRAKIPFSSFRCVSMGGGAMLSYLAGEELPALRALQTTT